MFDTSWLIHSSYATFNIKEYALGDGGEDVSLPIKEIYRDKQIGILKVVNVQVNYFLIKSLISKS